MLRDEQMMHEIFFSLIEIMQEKYSDLLFWNYIM
jgi:hypothetical protein